MSTPPPIKPPRGMKQGRETSGLLMSVIRTLSASETNEQRDREKAKLEKEYKKCDQRVDELVSQHDDELAQVMQVFGSVCAAVGACRARVRGARARLSSCKQLLRWRRAELRRLCGESAQHRHALKLLQQIEQLTGVGAELSGHLAKGHFLNAASVLQAALVTAQTSLCRVEALQYLRTEMETKRQTVYDCVIGQLNLALYQINIDDVALKRQGSSRRPEPPRLKSMRSEDDAVDVTPQFETLLSEEARTPEINFAILVESLAAVDKLRESAEAVKVQMQTELLRVMRSTSQAVLEGGSEAHPLAELTALLLEHFRIIASRHSLLLDVWKRALHKYAIPTTQLYTLQHYWSRVQAVLQLLLTDYLDVRSLKAGPQPVTFLEQPVNVDVNSYFIKKKQQSKKKSRLFKFSGSAVEEKVSEGAASQRGDALAGNSDGDDGCRPVCAPAPEHLALIYHMLDDFMEEIEIDIGAECSLRVFVGELVRGAQADRTAGRLRATVVDLCAEPVAWRELHVSPLSPAKNRTLFKCGVSCWDECEVALRSALKLRRLGPEAARSALHPALAALHTAAKRRIAQYAPRARSHVWLADQDITRFLKGLPNWQLLKNPPGKGKREDQILPEDMKPSFEREAEILGSSLGDSDISEKEIISNVSTLVDVAVMCETTEWLAEKIESWSDGSATSDRAVTPGRSGADSKRDALHAELTQSAALFRDLADNCILLLHLEVRMQCFHYLGRLGTDPGGTSSTTSSRLTADSPAAALARTLQSFTERATPVLHRRTMNYLMEGLGEMMSGAVVAGWRGRGRGASPEKAARQLEPLRHSLAGARVSADGLHRAALYLNMLNMSHEEILALVTEKGAVFSELEYMNAFQVIAKSRNLPDSLLKTNMTKLSNVLGNVGVTV